MMTETTTTTTMMTWRRIPAIIRPDAAPMVAGAAGQISPAAVVTVVAVAHGVAALVVAKSAAADNQDQVEGEEGAAASAAEAHVAESHVGEASEAEAPGDERRSQNVAGEGKRKEVEEASPQRNQARPHILVRRKPSGTVTSQNLQVAAPSVTVTLVAHVPPGYAPDLVAAIAQVRHNVDQEKLKTLTLKEITAHGSSTSKTTEVPSEHSPI